MIQAKFSLEEEHVQVLERCRKHGFKDKSAMVRAAIDLLSAVLERQRLRESAEKYAELYEGESERTESVQSEWPK